VQRLEPASNETVPLQAIFEELRQTLAGSMRTTDAELHVAALPAVSGHRGLLSLLFQNLLSNAIKFVAPGIAPDVRVSATVQGGDVLVTVADNGIGISAADQLRLFKPFSRLHLRRQYEGSGLGLVLARQIARLHGGDVSLDSQPGQGSRFVVRLPAAMQ
jgi:two-component system sensor histidine kinase/response regulator